MKKAWAVVKVYCGKSRDGEVDLIETQETEQEARAAATKHIPVSKQEQPFMLVIIPTNQVPNCPVGGGSKKVLAFCNETKWAVK